jgi:hypothetical protein
MFEGIEIVCISRIGRDYALQFSDGTYYGIFAAEDIDAMLRDRGPFLVTDLHDVTINTWRLGGC